MEPLDDSESPTSPFFRELQFIGFIVCFAVVYVSTFFVPPSSPPSFGRLLASSDPDALFRYAEFCRFGHLPDSFHADLVRIDLDCASRFYRRAAQSGHPSALLSLAEMLLLHNINMSEARALFEAYPRSDPAVAALGFLLLMQNASDARARRMVADGRSPLARFLQARLAGDDIDAFRSAGDFPPARLEVARLNESEAREIYTELAQAGNAEAMDRLGRLLASEEGCEAGRRWLATAANLGHRAAEMTLLDCTQAEADGTVAESGDAREEGANVASKATQLCDSTAASEYVASHRAGTSSESQPTQLSESAVSDDARPIFESQTTQLCQSPVSDEAGSGFEKQTPQLSESETASELVVFLGVYGSHATKLDRSAPCHQTGTDSESYATSLYESTASHESATSFELQTAQLYESGMSHEFRPSFESQTAQLCESAFVHEFRPSFESQMAQLYDIEAYDRESIVSSASAGSHWVRASGGPETTIISVASAANVGLRTMTSSERIASPQIGTLQTESHSRHAPSESAVRVRFSSEAATAEPFTSAGSVPESELISQVSGQPEELTASSEHAAESSAPVREATTETPPGEL